MRDLTRRTELGKMFLDVAKYVLTIVVIGGLFSGQIGFGSLVFGAILGMIIAVVGFNVIPQEQEKEKEENGS